MATNIAGLPPIQGADAAGVKIDINSPEVIAYMRQYPAVSPEAALGSVLQNMNARAAGATPMPTPSTAGTPGFGGGITPPVVKPPAPAAGGGTGTPGGDSTSPMYGSQSAFMNAYSQIMNKATKNQSLQDQKNLLLKQLYDQPLTPDELRTLSPTQQQAIQSADKGMIEYQILSLNDVVKGRTDDVKSSLDYMLQGYQLDQQTAKELAASAEAKKTDAFNIISTIGKYGADALKAVGITEEELKSVLESGEITPDFAIKVMKLQGLGTGGIEYQSAGGKEYADYVANEKARGNNKPMSLNEYMNMDANRKRSVTNISSGDSANAKASAIMLQLEASRGKDGFVNTETYKSLRLKDPATFKSYIDPQSHLYLNPKDATAQPYLATNANAYKDENPTDNGTSEILDLINQNWPDDTK